MILSGQILPFRDTFSHAPGIDEVLVINSSMLLGREKLYKNSTFRILLFYTQITAYVIK